MTGDAAFSRRSAALRAEPVALSQAKPAAAIATRIGDLPERLFAHSLSELIGDDEEREPSAFFHEVQDAVGLLAEIRNAASCTCGERPGGDDLGHDIDCPSSPLQAQLLYEPEAVNEDGWTDWIKPLPGYVLQCCDCGSLHEMEFAVEDGDVVFRAKPIDALAAGSRRAETPSAAQCEASQSGDAKAAQRPTDGGSNVTRD